MTYLETNATDELRLAYRIRMPGLGWHIFFAKLQKKGEMANRIFVFGCEFGGGRDKIGKNVVPLQPVSKSKGNLIM